ncbi:hypothetical protein, partial [Candidatus Williamhamiltonella defendens]|uniref:hypothetical protein n=1 Tax=Candidatus Williamhamiltonella defendens TaxID=138072 RepID=UPI001EE7501D
NITSAPDRSSFAHEQTEILSLFFRKKTAAFFKISRSINRLVRSLLWRIHSSPSDTPGFACSAPVDPFSALTLRRIALNETPKLSAASR